MEKNSKLLQVNHNKGRGGQNKGAYYKPELVIPKKCIHCEDEFIKTFKETYKHYKIRKFCSLWCYQSWQKGKHKQMNPHSFKNLVHGFIKGLIPWNKGIPFLQMRGENHPSWKGGTTPINHKIRTSLEYKLWREAVFKRDNYTCVWCKIKGYLNADHIRMFAYRPELRFELSNGRTLCEACHAWKTKWDMKIYKGKVPELNIV